MSNLLEQASLVMIPSGYKEDVVYSEIPINGAGDLAFTRASNGTRINSQGFVETVPWNLFTYSEDFANADWIKVGSTISSNVLVAPNGTTTADKLVEDTSNGVHIALQISGERNVNSIYAFSVYAKAGERTKINLFNNGNGLGNANFDLSNGTATLIAGEFATIESVGNGWYRCVVGMQENSTVGNFNYHIRLLDASGSDSYTGNGTSGAYIWGAQVNLGTAKPYFPTTDRLNVPRLTYQNGGGGCPSLLLEKQSTNLVIYSEQFDNASWTKQNGSTITANSVISPDGTQNADTLNVTTTAYSSVYNTTPYSASTGVYTQSIYAKKGTKNWLYILDLGGSGAKAWFNLDAGVVGTVASGYTATMENVGNGWYRCILTETANRLPLYFQFGASDADNSFQPSSAGTAFVWGAQLEAGSYATSVINTTSSSATRVSDACFKNNFSGLSSQAELTLYTEFTFEQLGRVIAIGDGSVNNRCFISYAATKEIQLFLNIGGTNIFFLTSASNLVLTGKNKVAAKIKSGATLLYLNGVQIFNDTSTFTLANLSNVYIGTNEFGSDNNVQKIGESVIFYSALTATELASLTTI